MQPPRQGGALAKRHRHVTRCGVELPVHPTERLAHAVNRRRAAKAKQKLYAEAIQQSMQRRGRGHTSGSLTVQSLIVRGDGQRGHTLRTV